MSGEDVRHLLRSNEAFYRALGGRDLELMDGVWAPVAQATCIHPGWRRLHGWPAIRQSWAAIFRNTPAWRVACDEVQAGCGGDAGWVTCLELIQSADPEDLPSVMLATNVFVRWQGEFRLLHHHASPAFGDGPAPGGVVN